MRNWMRLVIFGAIVATITITIAPPVRTSADAGSAGAVQAPPAPDDILGTYAGNITSDPPGALPGGGTIVIRRAGDALVVTGGPDVETQYPSSKVTRTVDGIAFEIAIEGETSGVLRFDLKVTGREMTGAIVAVRDGSETHGRLAFTRQ